MKDHGRISKRGYPVALAAMIALAAAIAVPATAKKPVVKGAKLDFRLPDLAGESVSSTDARFAGQVLFVNLWATWCTPCLTEIPTLVDLQARYGDRGLVIVAVAFEAEDEEDQRRARLRKFVTERGINYLVLDGGLPEDFENVFPAVKNVRGLPVEILIDRDGRVAAVRNGYGFKKKWAAKLRREIEALLHATTD
jgi:thiol-disulfide isomerase/thioredoxin